ncbi:MAG: CoA pyrophosphatase [Pseudomonadota bacterium]
MTSAADSKPAAVLVPITNAAEPEVLLTLRASTLTAHSGQIAFPGGRIDGPEETIASAALREADEEIGLASRDVELLGMLDRHRTGTGYTIYPIVGLIPPAFTPVCNPDEVAEVFRVPLAFVMDPDNMTRHTIAEGARARTFHALTYRHFFIWGATAAIINNAQERWLI